MPLSNTLFLHIAQMAHEDVNVKKKKKGGSHSCQEHGMSWVVCFTKCCTLESDWAADSRCGVGQWQILDSSWIIKANQKYWTDIFHVIKQAEIFRYCIIHCWLELFEHNWNGLFFYCCSAAAWSQRYVLNCLTGSIVWQDGLYYFEF